jgi:hypothetical protein
MRIDAVRAAHGLGAYAYQTGQTITSGVTVMRAQDVLELREALREAYVAAGRPAPAFSANPAAGMAISAAHIREIREALNNIE